MDENFLWEDKPELNITPLVDIMLVLLAILMVTTPTIVYQEDITLPKGTKSTKRALDNTLEIRIDREKKVYIKNNSLGHIGRWRVGGRRGSEKITSRY